MICIIFAEQPLYLRDRCNRNTRLVNDPLYSRKAVSQYLEKRPTRQYHGGDRRKFHTMVTKTYNSSERTQKKSKTSNDVHKKKSKTCPCYGCFKEIKKDPNVRICSKRRFCKVCEGIYPTTLQWLCQKES